MSSTITLRRLLLAPSPLRTALIIPYPRQSIRRFSVPTILQPSFWTSLIPKPLRRSSDPSNLKVKEKKSKAWNPATFYIWAYMMIGSMAMQMIGLKMRFSLSMNRADAKISLLNHVIERVQKGEEIDVAGLLGKGDKQKELEWEEMLREAENEAELFKKSGKKARKAEEDPTPNSTESPKPPRTGAPAGFY